MKSTNVMSLAIIASLICAIFSGAADAETKRTRYSSQDEWNIRAENLTPFGVNPYYHPLKPGFKYTMDNPLFDDDGVKGHYHKTIVVLDETEKFDIPSIGGKFECAVVEEKEFLDGNVFSRSLNWYCIDKINNNVYTFGELAWETKDVRGDLGDTVTESWRTGEKDDNGLIDAGLIMPGTFLRGARWMIDCAEGQTMVGGEALETGVTMVTPSGTYTNCVQTREYDLMDPEDVTDKVWAYGIGLVFDTSDGKLLKSDALEGREPTQAPDKKIITEKEAEAIAVKAVPGKVTGIAIEKKLGDNRYVVEVIADADGVETDVIIHLETGKVLGTEK